MNDHSHYEELAALLAGGFLSDAERIELYEHTKVCLDCLKAEEEFSGLVRSGLPLTVSTAREFVDRVKTQSDDGMRARFLQRARREGIVLTPGVEGPTRHRGRRVGFFVAAATAVAIAIVAVAFYGTYSRLFSREAVRTQQQVNQLKRENALLTVNLSQLNQSLAEGQREIQNLRAQLGNAATTAEELRRNSEQSSSRNVQLLDEASDQEKLLAEARDEAARVNQLRINDQASLAEQQDRITELSYKLRIASATIDMERQLAAAGKDVRELMLAHELHVIDVHDTDPNGNSSKAFGRVFLTEGKSLTFYGFDLGEDRELDAKRGFLVWAVTDDNKNSSRSLGFLRLDTRAQGRWVLKVENPQLVKGINSVFVTVEPSTGGKQPSGPKMLYAYLGQANHP